MDRDSTSLFMALYASSSSGGRGIFLSLLLLGSREEPVGRGHDQEAHVPAAPVAEDDPGSLVDQRRLGPARGHGERAAGVLSQEIVSEAVVRGRVFAA